MVFNKSYAALTLILFTVEVVIALFVHDHIIRPYLGDVLVVTVSIEKFRENKLQ